MISAIPHPSIYNCEGTVNPTDLSGLAFPGTVNCAFLLQKLTGGWRWSRLLSLAGYPLPDSAPSVILPDLSLSRYRTCAAAGETAAWCWLAWWSQQWRPVAGRGISTSGGGAMKRRSSSGGTGQVRAMDAPDDMTPTASEEESPWRCRGFSKVSFLSC